MPQGRAEGDFCNDHRPPPLDDPPPLTFVDLETTGLEPRDDRIVEIGVLVLSPDAGPARYLWRLDPGIPIPEAARAVHDIGEEDVAGCPRFGEIARDLAELLADADLAGFNLRRFDLPMLAAEFARDGVGFAVAERAVIDTQRIFYDLERRDPAAAVQFYRGREHQGAHGTLADAEGPRRCSTPSSAATPTCPGRPRLSTGR